jgi:hypothetical protein
MNCQSKGEDCRYKEQEMDKTNDDLAVRPTLGKSSIVRASNYTTLRTCSLTDNTKSLDLSMEQLELLYTYMSETCYHVASSQSSKSLQIWRDHVPRIGLQHRFLAHSMLALSSRHLHNLHKGNGNFDQLAAEHYHEAARLMAMEMAHISEINAEPILLSSALALLLSYAMADMVPFVRSSNLELDIFALSMGPRHISVGFLDLLGRNGVLDPLLGIENATGQEAEKKHIFLPFVYPLRQRIVDLAILGKFSPEHEQCYLETIRCLERWTLRAVLSLDETCLIVFPMFACDSEYVYLLRKGEPMAQIILAYYFGTLHSIHERFWVGKRPYNEIQNILSKVGDEWSEFLEWPIKVSAMADFNIPLLAEVL